MAFEQGDSLTREKIKQNNRFRVYQLLRESEALSIQEMSLQLGLSLPTVAKNVSDLEEEGLASVVGERKNTGGRSSKLYTGAANFRASVGVNITKHHISCVVVNLKGSILSQIRFRENFRQTDDYFQKVGKTVADMVSSSGVAKERILGVSVVMPALITQDARSTYYNRALRIKPVMYTTDFSPYIPYPIRFVHDGTAGAYAENWFNHDLKDFFYMSIGDSIIGNPIISGKPYTGFNNRSGEIGHVRLIKNGKLCYCGKRGCMDPYCSTSVLSSLTKGDLARYFQLLEEENEDAKKRWSDYVRFLALALNTVRMMYDCSIVIGGYLGQYMNPSCLDEIIQLTSEEDPFCEAADYISICKYKQEASATGGALLYLDEFVKTI